MEYFPFFTIRILFCWSVLTWYSHCLFRESCLGPTNSVDRYKDTESRTRLCGRHHTNSKPQTPSFQSRCIMIFLTRDGLALHATKACGASSMPRRQKGRSAQLA